jgi:threonine/homoserine/homoserine lactone efflux protein
MFLDDVPINYWGVLVAAIVYFIVGCIWYSPLLFGNQWGRHDEKLETKHGYLRQASSYIGELIISLIIAYVLALFIQISQANEIVEGITVALWVWIGFIATTHFSAVLWARKTIEHFFIHASFMLVGLIAMGAVIIYMGV